jgi:hypothetical protein
MVYRSPAVPLIPAGLAGETAQAPTSRLRPLARPGAILRARRCAFRIASARSICAADRGGPRCWSESCPLVHCPASRSRAVSVCSLTVVMPPIGKKPQLVGPKDALRGGGAVRPEDFSGSAEFVPVTATAMISWVHHSNKLCKQQCNPLSSQRKDNKRRAQDSGRWTALRG